MRRIISTAISVISSHANLVILVLAIVVAILTILLFIQRKRRRLLLKRRDNKEKEFLLRQEEANNEISSTTRALQESKALNEKLKHVIKENENSLDECIRVNESLKQTISSRETELTALSLKISDLTRQLDTQTELLRQENEALDEKNNIIDNLHRSITELKQKVLDNQTYHPSRNEELEDQIESLRRQVDQLKESNESLKKENEKLVAENDNKASSILQLEEKISLTSKTSLPDDSIVSYVPSLSTIIDYPEKTTRAIDTVIDVDTNQEIHAVSFFNLPESAIFQKRSELEKAIILKRPKYVCKYCGQMIRISGRNTERGKARFFSHLRDSDYCDCKTTTGKSKREIERIKYCDVANEGFRHKHLKDSVAKFLQQTEGISDVQVEKYTKGSHPLFRWRRPDITAKYRGQDIVFEIQLSTTFVSVITERDLFYRMNKTHIIWVFNFDNYQQYLDLNSMMVRDVYFNNRMNIFLFDHDAELESERRGELILKCNYLNPDDSWEFGFSPSDDKSILFVSLSELTYPDNYKPYYFDAETPYYRNKPLFAERVEKIEEENDQILKDLDRLWEEEKQSEEKNVQEIVENYEIDRVIRNNKHFIIGSRNDLQGLITRDGILQIPFNYNKIVVHRGWYEGITDNWIDFYDMNYHPTISEVTSYKKTGIEDLLFYVKKVDGNYLQGLMTSLGNPVTPARYTKLELWSQDRLLARRDGFYCLLDRNGFESLQGYSQIGGLQDDGNIPVTKDGRHFLVNIQGDSIVTERISINDNLAKVLEAGRWGIEDGQNNRIIPCEYDEIGSLNNQFVGIKGDSVVPLENWTQSGVPVKASFVKRNDQNKLIFKVGQREAFMNYKQQQKAQKNGINPETLNEFYFSHVNTERGLLYLSVDSVRFFPVLNKNEEIELDYVLKGVIIDIRSNGVIARDPLGISAFIHKTMLSERLENYVLGQQIAVQKKGYDTVNGRHIWQAWRAVPSLRQYIRKVRTRNTRSDGQNM